MAHLEVIVTEYPELPAGMRLTVPAKLDARLTIGRAPSSALRINDETVSRLHATLEGGARALLLKDHSENGTFLNGLRVSEPEAVVDGDGLEVGRLTLRWVARKPTRLVPPMIDTMLTANPRDTGAWSVWADWLLEREEPLGEWLQATTRTPSALGRQLGPLARAVAEQRLHVIWNEFGFLDTLTLAGANDLAPIDRLPLVPGARFLVGLELQVTTASELMSRLDSVCAANLPKSLRTLTFVSRGPTPPNQISAGDIVEALAPRITEALRRLRGRCPSLETTPATLVRRRASRSPR